MMKPAACFLRFKVNNIRYVARYIAPRFYRLVKKAQLTHNIFQVRLIFFYVFMQAQPCAAALN